SGTSGLTFSSGDGTADAAMTFTGTLANLNNALVGLSYQPTANYNGSDTLTIATNDQGNTGSGGALSDTETVALTVTAVNDAPVATNDGYSTSEDTPLTLAAAGVVANDTDIDGDLLAAVLVSGPANGSLTLNANGSFVYTPNANFNGTDSFTYQANDGTANSGVATVTLAITAVNDAPVAAGDNYSVNEYGV